MHLLRYLGAGLVVGMLASLPFSFALRLRQDEQIIVPVVLAAIGAVACAAIATVAAFTANRSKQGAVSSRIFYWCSTGLLAGLVFAVPVAFATNAGSDSDTVFARALMTVLVSIAAIAVFAAYGMLTRRAGSGETFLPVRSSKPLNPAFGNIVLVAMVLIGSLNRLAALSDSHSYAFDAFIATALIVWIVIVCMIIRYTTKRYHKKLAEWQAAHACPDDGVADA